MKKKILKTSLITVIVILATYLIVWGVTCIVYPVGLAKVHAELNDYKGATRFYEIDYKRNPSTSKLENLTEFSYMAKEHKKVVKYGEKLIDDEDFNASIENEFYIDLCCFIIGSKYSLGHSDTVEKAINLAVVIENEKIVAFNDACLDLLILKADDNQDEQTLIDIENALLAVQADMTELSNELKMELGLKLYYLQQILLQYN
jgi:hypothetical protein